MGTPLRVLIVEDSEDDTMLLVRELQRGGYDPVFERVDTPKGMNAALDKEAWEIVIADYVMPHFSGLAALTLLKERGLDLPFIIVSGKIGEEVAVEALKAGAHDYIMKNNLTRFVSAVGHELQEVVVRQERKRAEETVNRQHDELTVHSQIIAATLQSFDLDERLNVILANVIRLVTVDIAAVYLVKGNTIILQTWQGMSDEFRANMMSFPIEQAPDWMTSSYLIHERLSEKQQTLEFARREGIQAWASIPLKLPRHGDNKPDELLGTIFLGSCRYEALGKDEVQTLEVIANQLALTIDHSRSYRQAEERLIRLQVLREIDKAIMSHLDMRHIMHLVLERMPKALGADAEAISLLDEKQLQTKVFSMRLPNGTIITEEAFNIANSLLYKFVRGQEHVIIYDLTQDPRVQMDRELIRNSRLISYLGVPLVVHNKTIGIMHILTTQPKVFTDEDVAFFRTLAGQTAIAIENARLYQEMSESHDAVLNMMEDAVEARNTLEISNKKLVEEITERKRAEEEIISQKNRFAQLFENSLLAIALIDNNNKIIQLNNSFKELFEYTLEEAVGYNIDDLVVPNEIKEEGKTFTNEALSGRKMSKESYRMKKDGSLVFVKAIAVPIIINAKTIGHYAMYVDLTHRKKAEEEIQLAREKAEEANRLKSGFLAVMSHEIRTPLNVILGYNGVLRDLFDDPSNPKLTMYFNSIEKGSLRLLNTVTQILDMSRIVAGEFEINLCPLSMNSAITSNYNQLKVLADKKKLGINLKLPKTDIKVIADGYCLDGVLINVLNNAIKYSHKGTIEVRLDVEKDFAVCTVKDEGIGMSEEYQKHLFQTFSQEDVSISRPYEGTGLGLALTNEYIKLMNGEIQIESAKGVGTKVTFKLPLSK